MTTSKQKNPEVYARNNIDDSIDQVSAGGVVFRRCKDNKIRVALLRKANTRKWILPKGRIEKGESLEETSLREIKEETGLRNLKLIDKIDKTNYWFRTRSKQKLTKEVHFFLYQDEDESDDICFEDNHFDKGQWFTKEEAIRNIGYSAQKKILYKAFRLIESDSTN